MIFRINHKYQKAILVSIVIFITLLIETDSRWTHISPLKSHKFSAEVHSELS